MIQSQKNIDIKELRTLQILEQIEEDETISQRTMANNLDVSLGLVNSFVKRLVKKGYVKVSTIPRNRISYLLTPKGVAEKTALTYEYIKYSFSLYKTMRERLFKIYDKLYKDGIRKVAFFGATELTEIAYITIQQSKLKLIGVYDDRQGKIIGLEINNINKLNKILFDKIIYLDFNSNEEKYSLLKTKVDESQIIKLS